MGTPNRQSAGELTPEDLIAADEVANPGGWVDENGEPTEPPVDLGHHSAFTTDELEQAANDPTVHFGDKGRLVSRAPPRAQSRESFIMRDPGDGKPHRVDRGAFNDEEWMAIMRSAAGSPAGLRPPPMPSQFEFMDPASHQTVKVVRTPDMTDTDWQYLLDLPRKKPRGHR